MYGDRKLVCLRFSSISWKGAPSTKENRICGSVNLMYETDLCGRGGGDLFDACHLHIAWSILPQVQEADGRIEQVTDHLVVDLRFKQCRETQRLVTKLFREPLDIGGGVLAQRLRPLTPRHKVPGLDHCLRHKHPWARVFFIP